MANKRTDKEKGIILEAIISEFEQSRSPALRKIKTSDTTSHRLDGILASLGRSF
jgi:hypothetical protein